VVNFTQKLAKFYARENLSVINATGVFTNAGRNTRNNN